MRKPKTRKPPLPIGTPVDINIAQGLAVARGVVTAADYDDGWLYRIDITGGDDCRAYRNDAGELWVCEHEVSPRPAEPAGERESHMPHTVEVVSDFLVVLDEDGCGCECCRLTGLRTAKRQLRRWQDEYTFDYAGAMSAVSEFFRKQNER